MFINFFEKKLTFVFLLFCVPLLFLPKYNLVSIGSETAGIRIDDIILFIAALILVWAHLLLNKRISEIEKRIFLLTFFSLFSFFSNHVLVVMGILPISANILYALRLFEYFIFFYIGMMTSRFFNGDSIVRTFFVWNVILMLLQKLNIAGGITSAGYTDVSSRVQGVASFPSEMGLLLNLLFCYLIYSQKKSKFLQIFPLSFRYILNKFYLPLTFMIFGIFVVFTGNRISILALLVCFILKIKEEFNWRSLTSLVVVSVVIVFLVQGVIAIMTRTEAVYERSMDLFSWKNLELVQQVWANVNLKVYTQSPEEVGKGYDMSWWLRIHKWLFMLKTYVAHPECYLQGLGPGFAGAALDGGFLRILTEYGLLGSFIFYRFFSYLYHLNMQTKWMMVAFFINMIFFDAYLAYKVMSLLLFICGYVLGCKNQIRDQNKEEEKELILPTLRKI